MAISASARHDHSSVPYCLYPYPTRHKTRIEAVPTRSPIRKNIDHDAAALHCARTEIRRSKTQSAQETVFGLVVPCLMSLIYGNTESIDMMPETTPRATCQFID